MSEHPSNPHTAPTNPPPWPQKPTNTNTFNGPNDTLNPENWPLRKKVSTTALWALTTCWITFASAIYSAGTTEISIEFSVSYNTANAGTSLLIFGFALGPLLWAPLCEVYGRKWPVLIVRPPNSPTST